jgi:quercetin dioxygenase-like cupin family protein
LSLEELAAASGVSRGWIGRVERGSVQPSVEVIRRIAEGLGVAPGTLLDDDRESESATTSPAGIEVVRRDRRTALRFPESQHFWEVLTPNLRGQLQVLVVEILPNEPHPIELFSHPGEEMFFVLSGEVTLEIEDQEVTLQAGDSATIASIRPHRLRNAGEDIAQVLSASTPPFF